MDRRNFFKTILTTPLFTPFLLSQNSSPAEIQLYLISDAPHEVVPFLLKELKKWNLVKGKYFGFINSHPHLKEIKRFLSNQGWVLTPNLSHAQLSLSYKFLQQKTAPSFTLIKEGRVWDIRTRKLYFLWKEMSQQPPTCFLTVLSFKKRINSTVSGKQVLVYKEGINVDKLSLSQNFTKTYPASRGKMTIKSRDGKVWVEEASCPRQICLHSHPIQVAGERIVCAPNNFLLEIKGGEAVDTSIG